MSNNGLTSKHLAYDKDDNPKARLLDYKPLETIPNEKRSYSWIPARFSLAFWTFCGLFVVYALRANLSVAIVAMVKSHPDAANGTNSSTSCPQMGNQTSPSNDYSEEGEFDWDDVTQGTILGAFFYGYIITQLPGGVLAERFGGKWLFGVGTLITAVTTILTPFAARCHVSLLIFARFVAGIGEGVTYPSYYALYSHWIPCQERSISLAITNSGALVGVIAAMPVTAWLCEHGFSGGWPSVFYVFGLVGCAWFCFWAFLISERPENHPYIKPSELRYIVENRGREKKTLHFRSIPWKYILTSWPVWALGLTKLGNNWSFYTILTELPNFLRQVLNFSIEANGNVNSLLYVCIAVSVVGTGALSDVIRAQEWFSVTTLRKMFQVVASFLPAVFLSLVPFMGCNNTSVIALLLAAMAGTGFNAGGEGPSSLDMAPEYIASFLPAVFLSLVPFMGCNNTSVIALLLAAMAGTGFNAGGEGPSSLDMAPEYIGVVFGLTNCIGNMAGFLAPLATGYIISGEVGYEKWQYVFYLASAMNIIGGLAFLMFGSASPQPWPSPYQSIPTSSKKLQADCDNISDSKSIQAS